MVINKEVNVTATFTQKGLEKFRKNINSWNASMSAPLSRMKEVSDGQGGWNKESKEGETRMGRMALGLRQSVHGLRGFKMEMLGVMFFGMAMQRMFSGLLKTSLEWTGVMELLSTTLGVLFLPIALELLDVLMPLFTWLMNLDDGTKLWIGRLVVLGVIVGTVLMIFGQLALGIGSILLVLATGMAPLLTFSAWFVGIGIIIAGVIIAFKNWGKDVGKTLVGVGIAILGVGLILALFIGWWALIPIAVGLAVAAIGVNWDKLPDIIKTPLETIWGYMDKFFIQPLKDVLRMIQAVSDAWSKLKSGGSVNISSIMSSIGRVALNTALPGRAGNIINNKLRPTTPSNSSANLPQSNFDNVTQGSGTSITNNFNGFSTDELKRELDDINRTMVAQMEASR